MNMQKNNKNIDPNFILRWDDKIIQVLFQQYRNERLSKNERELYFWLAINRNSIMRVKINLPAWRWTLKFYKNDTETKTPSNKTI
jgi:hypothetical protein